MSVIRVSGTDDPDEIAAVLAAVSSLRVRGGTSRPTGYERWRQLRLEALRRSS